MNHRTNTYLTTFLFCLLVLPVTFAQAGIPVICGEYHMAYQGPETLTLLVFPDGGGAPLSQALLPWGDREDATITMNMWDVGENPIAYFPAEDMWLESRDNGLVPCMGGTIADSNTDASGSTTWAAPLHAGGHSEALADVIVNGSILGDSPSGLALSFNSPDINGDLVVNLLDLQLFAVDYRYGYDFRSDFHRDGVINLVDLFWMVQAFGANCP